MPADVSEVRLARRLRVALLRRARRARLRCKCHRQQVRPFVSTSGKASSSGRLMTVQLAQSAAATSKHDGRQLHFRSCTRTTSEMQNGATCSPYSPYSPNRGRNRLTLETFEAFISSVPQGGRQCKLDWFGIDQTGNCPYSSSWLRNPSLDRADEPDFQALLPRFSATSSARHAEAAYKRRECRCISERGCNARNSSISRGL